MGGSAKEGTNPDDLRRMMAWQYVQNAATHAGNIFSSPDQRRQPAPINPMLPLQLQLTQAQLKKIEREDAASKQFADMLQAGIMPTEPKPAMDPMGIGEVSPPEMHSANTAARGPFADIPPNIRQTAAMLERIDPGKGMDYLAQFRAKQVPGPLGPRDKAFAGLTPEQQAMSLGAAPKPQAPPAGYTQDPDGRLRFIPGGPADPATIGNQADARNPFYFQDVHNPDGTVSRIAVPRGQVKGGTISTKPYVATEAQGRNALYADRMANSNSILEDVERQGASFWGRVKADIPGGNYLQSPEYQKFDQAQRDFINATLRRESGAVISEAEFANAQKQYFPVPGDSDEVIMQKRRNREAALNGIRREAGPGYKPPEISKGTPAVPRPGDVLEGYRFKGGNPADPMAWEKVR